MVDDAQTAAGGLRKTAQWIASALAAIPALGIVSSLIKGPGDAGYSVPLLLGGVVLAAIGAYLGIYWFSNVLAPLALEDVTVAGFDMRRLPGNPYANYAALTKALDDRRNDHIQSQADAEDAKVVSEAAGADAAAAEAHALLLEADLVQHQPD